MLRRSPPAQRLPPGKNAAKPNEDRFYPNKTERPQAAALSCLQTRARVSTCGRCVIVYGLADASIIKTVYATLEAAVAVPTTKATAAGTAVAGAIFRFVDLDAAAVKLGAI